MIGLGFYQFKFTVDSQSQVAKDIGGVQSSRLYHEPNDG